MVNAMSAKGRIFRLETGPHFACLEASAFTVPGTCFKAGAPLSYKCDGDSSALSKCSELLPVQVPVRVLSLEKSTNQMKRTLLFTQM